MNTKLLISDKGLDTDQSNSSPNVQLVELISFEGPYRSRTELKTALTLKDHLNMYHGSQNYNLGVLSLKYR